MKLNGCAGPPVVTVVPNRVDDGMKVTCRRYTDGRDGAEVVLYTIEGGGHTWPGQTPRLPLIGKSTANLSANDVMWEFFQRHPMP